MDRRRTNFSEDTVNTRRVYLGYFHDWCQERGLESPIEITRPDSGALPAVALSLPQERTASRSASARSTARLQCHQELLPVDGAAEPSAAQPGLRARCCRGWRTACPSTSSPRAKPSRCLQQPDVTDPEGLRDRAILETFYSTGMRRMEAGEPEALRPRRRARHGDDPPGQGQERPHDSRSASGRWPGSTNTSASRARNC